MSTSAVRVVALGSFRLETPSGVVHRLPTRKATALLAQLALDPRPHERNDLQRTYWPEDSAEKGRLSLRQALSMIRRTLPEPNLLVSDEQTVALEGVASDVSEFRLRSQRANGVEESERVPELLATLEMYAEPLPGWSEPWVADLRAELAADALDLTIQLSALLAPTDREAALLWIRRALDIDPEDEEALALLQQLESNPNLDVSRFRRRVWPPMAADREVPSGAAELEQVIQLYLHHDTDRAIEMLSTNGEVLANLGYRRVLPLYRQATQLTQRSSEHYGRLNGTLGHIYHRLGAYGRSEQILREVVDWSRARGQAHVEAQALITLGLIGLEQGNITPNHPAIGRLWELDRQTPKDPVGAYGFSIEGAHRWQGGDIEKGWQYVRESVRRAAGQGLGRVARWNLANMSIVSWELGALEAMEEFRTMGTHAAEAFGDRYLAYAFEYILGAELILQRRYEEAVLQLVPLVDDPRRDLGRMHILVCEALGLAAACSGQVDVAIDALARAYIRRRDMGHLPTVTERRHLRRAYGELEVRIGTSEVDRRLDRAIENLAAPKRN